MKSFRAYGSQAVIIVGGVVLILLLQSWYLAPPHALEGQAAPAFDAELLDGGRLAFEGGGGENIVVLDFWAIWCPPCREGLPALARLAREYGERGVDVFAINQGDAPERIAGFMEDMEITLVVGLDPEGRIGAAYGVRAIPQTVIIDGDGVVVKVYLGSGPGLEAEIRGVLDGLLAARSSGVAVP